MAYDAERGVHRLLGAHGFHDRVSAVAPGQLPDTLDAFLAAFGDDIGGAELPAEAGTVLVPAHQDDLLGAQPLRGQHGTQPDRAVTDDRHGLAGADPGGHHTVMAGAVHIGQGEQRGQERGVLGDGQLDQRAVGLRDADRLALAAVHAVPGVEAAVAAGDLQALAAEVAGVVRPDEPGAAVAPALPEEPAM